MKTHIILVAAALVPFASADPGNYDYHYETTGPLGANIWGVGTYGAGYCMGAVGPNVGSPSGDFSCDPSVGTVKSAGFARMDVSNQNGNWPGMPPQSFALRVNVEYVPDSGFDLSGFHVLVCTDRDDDNACHGGNGVDHGAEAYANADEGNGCKKDTKNKKVCDGTDAELFFCVERDEPLDFLGFPDGEWDEVWVFISAWIKESATGLTGNNPELLDFGTTMGNFDVYGEFFGFSECRGGPWDGTTLDP